MMKKKEYQSPQIEVILLKNDCQLLQASEVKLPLIEEETIEQF